MKRIVLACWLSVVLAGVAHAQTQTSHTISSAATGAKLANSINTAISVFVETGGTSVWVGRFVKGVDCSTAQTATAGKAMMIPADSGWLFLRKEEQFTGALCAILDSAGTATVWTEEW
jgi:hypothetical protein